jgi:hypothetical protein
MTQGPLIEQSTDRASFRMVVTYEIQTDSLICRLDVKWLDKQLGEMFYVEQPKPTGRIMPTDPLIEPKGVITGSVVVADRATLIAALVKLTNHLRDAK